MAAKKSYTSKKGYDTKKKIFANCIYDHTEQLLL